MTLIYGLYAIEQAAAESTPHVLGFATARTTPGETLFEIWNAGTSAGLVYSVDLDGGVSMGALSATTGTFTGLVQAQLGLNVTGAALTATLATQQLRLAYDGSNYLAVTVGSTGVATFNTVGTGSYLDFTDRLVANVNTSGSGIPAFTLNTNQVPTAGLQPLLGMLFGPIFFDAGFSAITATGWDARCYTAGQGGDYTSATAVQVRLLDGGGSPVVTTGYGIYVDTIEVGTTKYAIYTNTGLVRLGDATAISGKLTTAAGRTHAYVAKTGTYTLTTADYGVLCTSGTFAVTLPTAVGVTGQEYNIVNTGTGVITLNTTSAQTISGEASGTITLNQYDSLGVVSDNANWIIK